MQQNFMLPASARRIPPVQATLFFTRSSLSRHNVCRMPNITTANPDIDRVMLMNIMALVTKMSAARVKEEEILQAENNTCC